MPDLRNHGDARGLAGPHTLDAACDDFADLAASLGHTFDAVIGVLLYALWRRPIRRSLLGSLPEPWATAALETTRVILPGRSPRVRWLLVAVSAMVGALTHVIIDIFTHERPETPDLLVDDTVFGLPIASHLQRGLSAVGLALIAWWVWRELSRVAPLSGWRMTPSLRAYAVVCCVLAVGAAARRLLMWEPQTLNGIVVTSLIGLCWGIGIGLLAVSLVLSLRRRVAPATSPVARSAPRTPG